MYLYIDAYVYLQKLSSVKMLAYGTMMIMFNKQEATIKMHMQKYLNLIS